MSMTTNVILRRLPEAATGLGVAAVLFGLVLLQVDAAPASGSVASGAEVPGAEIPGAEVPGAEVPGAEVPGAEVPGAEVPGAGTLSAGTPAAVTPSAGSPAAEASGAFQAAAPGAASSQSDDEEAPADLAAAFAKAGVFVDADAAALAFSAVIEIRNEPLEYLLVNPHGAAHEALFVTDADAQVLATAFLAVGAEEGQNVQYIEKDPAPTPDEMRAGVPTHEVVAPKGKPIFLYAAWREGAGSRDAATGAFEDESIHLHRVEDLVLDLARDRTMRRHGFVWLGSRMVPGNGPGVPPRFAAQSAGNLASVTFFSPADALLTTAIADCASQTNWHPNGWLLPPRGSEVLLVASMTPIESVPAVFLDALSFVAEPDPAAGSGGR